MAPSAGPGRAAHTGMQGQAGHSIARLESRNQHVPEEQGGSSRPTHSAPSSHVSRSPQIFSFPSSLPLALRVSSRTASQKEIGRDGRARAGCAAKSGTSKEREGGGGGGVSSRFWGFRCRSCEDCSHRPAGIGAIERKDLRCSG